jgi:hypothetical protein
VDSATISDLSQGWIVVTALIDELQLNASKHDVPVSSLLRQALMVAAKLNIPELPEWFEHELSGYPDGVEVPAYRELAGSVRARMVRGWLPVQFPTGDMQESLSSRPIGHAVAQLESLIAREGDLRYGYPVEVQAVLQEMFQQQAEFACFIDKSLLVGILDELRNRILRWAIALDKAGIRGEGMSFSQSEKERAGQITIRGDGAVVNVGVLGDANQSNVAAGSGSRAGDVTIKGADVRALVEEIQSHIAGLKLDVSDREELEATLHDLGKTKPDEQIEAGSVMPAVKKILGLVGKAGGTVISAGIKVYTEAWMRSHGLVP